MWSYAKEVYAGDGVKAASLSLQDELGVDVNVLLWCCYAAHQGVSLTPEDLRQADTAVAAWRDRVTVALRGVRQRIRQDPEIADLDGAQAIYQSIVSLEVESERVSQILLTRYLNGLTVKTAGVPARFCSLAMANLETYMRHLNLCVSGFVYQRLSVIVTAARSVDESSGDNR